MFNKEEKDQVWLDINEVVRDVLVLLQGELQAQGIVVRDDLTRQLPLVQGHEGQLQQQVILNLVRNAAEAMSQISDRARVPRVSSQREPPNGVLVSIEDSGTGIDPQHVDRLFEAFFTTKSNGMGMGLAIFRSIVEAHSGRLWASSDLNYGAVFHIALPAGESAAT